MILRTHEGILGKSWATIVVVIAAAATAATVTIVGHVFEERKGKEGKGKRMVNVVSGNAPESIAELKICFSDPVTERGTSFGFSFVVGKAALIRVHEYQSTLSSGHMGTRLL